MRVFIIFILISLNCYAQLDREEVLWDQLKDIYASEAPRNATWASELKEVLIKIKDLSSTSSNGPSYAHRVESFYIKLLKKAYGLPNNIPAVPTTTGLIQLHEDIIRKYNLYTFVFLLPNVYERGGHNRSFLRESLRLASSIENPGILYRLYRKWREYESIENSSYDRYLPEAPEMVWNTIQSHPMRVQSSIAELLRSSQFRYEGRELFEFLSSLYSLTQIKNFIEEVSASDLADSDYSFHRHYMQLLAQLPELSPMIINNLVEYYSHQEQLLGHLETLGPYKVIPYVFSYYSQLKMDRDKREERRNLRSLLRRFRRRVSTNQYTSLIIHGFCHPDQRNKEGAYQKLEEMRRTLPATELFEKMKYLGLFPQSHGKFRDAFQVFNCTEEDKISLLDLVSSKMRDDELGEFMVMLGEEDEAVIINALYVLAQKTEFAEIIAPRMIDLFGLDSSTRLQSTLELSLAKLFQNSYGRLVRMLNTDQILKVLRRAWHSPQFPKALKIDLGLHAIDHPNKLVSHSAMLWLESTDVVYDVRMVDPSGRSQAQRQYIRRLRYGNN